MDLCVVCEKPRTSQRWCEKHYNRWLYNGKDLTLQLRSCVLCESQFRVIESGFKSYCSSRCNALARGQRWGSCVWTRCDQPAEVTRLCRRHYVAFRAGASPRESKQSGWKLDANGYVWMSKRLGGSILQHRAVMENMLYDLRGYYEPLSERQTVHHKNGVRDDNRPENLQLRQGRHGPGAAFRCRTCGSQDVEAVEL